MTDHDPSPATDLLLDALTGDPAASWFVPGGEAALVAGLHDAHPGAHLHWQPVDLRERDALRLSPTIHIELPGAAVAGADAAVIAAPPERDLARRWLLGARQALPPGGRLYLAGANAEGIRSVVKDAAGLFGVPQREGYGGKQRLAVFAAGEAPGMLPDWAGEPGVMPGSWQPFIFDFDDAVLDLVTQPGVFAGNRVDAGTRLLLETLPPRLYGRVLDMGCGAGAIGLAVALRGADAVDMTDINLLAIQVAEENVTRAAASGIGAAFRVLASDVYGALGDGRYDVIVSNPPFHRGKEIDYTVADRLIAGAPARLESHGALLVVANAFLAYGKRMARVFREVETVAQTRQYHVLRARFPRRQADLYDAAGT